MSVSPSTLSTGAVIGILGGGQLGRMLALAAARLGLRSHVYAPEGDAPACELAHAVTRADYGDQVALACFGQQVDVITTEFENVPAETLRFLSRYAPVFPNPEAIAIVQDRLSEKSFIQESGSQTVDFIAIDSAEALQNARQNFEKAVLKTRRLGYDGKGQLRLDQSHENWAEAFNALGGKDLILERFAPFELEFSLVAARSQKGDIQCYAPAQNYHQNGILMESVVPAGIDSELELSARESVVNLLEAFEYVGVIGVEFFAVQGQALVNEIAPRVHNTGHWTEAVCGCDQFEQHIRAIAGWPLGDPQHFAGAKMQNLLGEAALGWENRVLPMGSKLHLYGKAEAKTGRKMGHITRLL